ncbi:uncharacterized protein LOC141613793 [Silene latifolia]|uniref:uncharacterized protein LOC141613793 n=1 Tax=Silene latifolia TaxID=37657 RepID=UPI003D76EE8C
MTPFEALYRRRCKSPLCWDDVTDLVVLGPQMIQEMVEQVHTICHKMRVVQDRQKSYADLKRSDIEFAVGDKVLLKVSPMKGSYAFLEERVGEVEYRLALPLALDRVHNVFHVSQPRKYVSDPSHILESEIVEMDESPTYVEIAKEILDRNIIKTRNGETVLVKVLWSNHDIEEAMWEPEDKINEKYPHLFDQV